MDDDKRRLLERSQEAIAAWESIVEWCRAHDAELTALWPERELARLRREAADG